MMIHRESINPNKNRVYFTLSKLSYAFLLLSGAMAVIGLFMAIYFTNFYDKSLLYFRWRWEWWLPPPLPLEMVVTAYNLFFSMIVAGTIGIFIFMPITIILGIKLKSLRSAYLTKEIGTNKDFIPVKIPNLALKSPRYIYYPY